MHRLQGKSKNRMFWTHAIRHFHVHVPLKNRKYDMKYGMKALILIYIDFFPDIREKVGFFLSTELSPACVSNVSSGVFTTSNEVWCVFLFSQHKHCAVAFKIQEDILGQPAKVWRLQRKLIYEPFLVWLVSFRAEEKHCKALMFQQASSCTCVLSLFT